MADLLTTPIVTDAISIAQIGYDSLATDLPGWEPSDSDAMTRFISANASMMAEVATKATQALQELLVTIGTTLGLPPYMAASATVASTWTLSDSAGHTIQAGTQVAIPTPGGGDPETFQVQADVTVTPGHAATTAGQVQLIAVDEGTAANDLTGTPVLLTDLSFVDPGGIALTASTGGGQDPESTSDYLVRFSQYVPLLALRLILAPDFATALVVLVPGIAHALAIDEYDADTNTSGVEKCVTVVVADENWQPVDPAIKTTALALLVAHRENSFQSFVIDPTSTPITIAYTGVAAAGYDPTDVRDRANAALTALLAAWGAPASGEATGTWVDRPTLFYQDIVTALNNVAGFDHYTALTVNGGTADVALAGPGALPDLTSITGTVT